MRADRLVAALLVLQAKGRVTAAELAAELEVSERTARRDLEALSMGGVPVYPLRGRGGGWELVGGYRTDLSGLTSDEARALFLVAGPGAAGTPEVRAALRKLVRALPEPLRAGAEAASSAVLVDPAGWGNEPDASPFLAPLRDAVVRRHQVVLGYARPNRPPTVRNLDPYGLVAKRGVWYVIGGTDQGLRTFRLSRVTAVEVTDTVFTRPGDFDLTAAWADITGEVNSWSTPCVVRLRARPDAVPWLLGRFGQRVETVEPAAPDADPDHPGDWAELDVSFASDYHARADLAGFGLRIEVLGPPSVRQLLAELGADLRQRYGDR